MEDFTSLKNIGFLNIACRKMINDKFDIELDEKELMNIIDGLVETIHDEFNTNELNIKEMNNIILGKVKDIVSNKSVDDNKASEIKLDDDLINIKLQELESRRKAIPEFSTRNIEETPKERHENIVYKPNPISITVPKNKKNNFKTLMINSINRDWIKQPLRNNIKFGMSLDTNHHLFFPHCMCLPSFVKNITPYVLMIISDGTKSIYYSFTTDCGQNNGKWDIWKTVENPENISLIGKIWSIKLLDFTNNELNLGEDKCKIIQAIQNDNSNVSNVSNEICLKYDKDIGNNIAIKLKNNKTIYKSITQTQTINEEKSFTICEDDLDITDFIDAHILNVDEQLSFIIKYCYKND